MDDAVLLAEALRIIIGTVLLDGCILDLRGRRDILRNSHELRLHHLFYLSLEICKPVHHFRRKVSASFLNDELHFVSELILKLCQLLINGGTLSVSLLTQL